MEATPLRSHKLAAAVAVAAVAAGGAAATQVASGATPKRPAAGTVRLSAAKNKLAFNTKTLHAKHGKVTLRMANPSSFPHAIAVEGHGVDKDGKKVGHGGTSTVSVTLKKGTYTFYCPVPGHRAAGMVGKLVVS
jgi:plastocyanin